MGGILVIVFYGLFWWFCSWLSKRIVKEQAPNSDAKRLRWFWGLALIPIYIFVYERSVIEVACRTADDYYPKEKISNPNALLVYSSETAEIYSKYFVGYMIAPKNIGFWKEESNQMLDRDEILKQDNVVYYQGKRLLDKNEVINISKDSIRYALFYSDEDIPFTSIGGNRYYIHDLESNLEVSSVESFYKGWSHSNVMKNYLLPYKLGGCGPVNEEEYILKNTFKEWREG